MFIDTAGDLVEVLGYWAKKVFYSATFGNKNEIF
jgi:hypothetical protein